MKKMYIAVLFGCLSLNATAAVEKRSIHETEQLQAEQSPSYVTVLTRDGAAQQIIEQYGLAVVYRDARTGVMVLDASLHDDMARLLAALRADEGVRAVRLSTLERPHQLPELGEALPLRGARG